MYIIFTLEKEHFCKIFSNLDDCYSIRPCGPPVPRLFIAILRIWYDRQSALFSRVLRSRLARHAASGDPASALLLHTAIYDKYETKQVNMLRFSYWLCMKFNIGTLWRYVYDCSCINFVLKLQHENTQDKKRKVKLHNLWLQ